ncbi:unnamed protein product [Hermetia illucens]|uniref:Uncharacterized protein n=1 Tax=Hermetia illucens TaxID=343691 RepID=A0A7R8US03_HERIL|nr:unnamed protein product [Hermetia illucens]
MSRFAQKPSSCTLNKLECITHSMLKVISREVKALQPEIVSRGNQILQDALAAGKQCNMDLRTKKDRHAFHKCIAGLQGKAIKDIASLKRRSNLNVVHR